jgi:hypothetical protein
VVEIMAELPFHASLLIGYSILSEAWFTRREMRRRPAEELQASDSCMRLVALADAQGGYFAPVLGG